MVRPLFLIALLISAGCSDDSPTSPSSSLEGTWRIISIQLAGQSMQTAPVGVQYQVRFEDERIIARVDCNTCTGPFEASANTVAIGPTLACTRAACATADFETAVVSLLSGEHQMASTLHNLTLTSSEGSILLQR